MLEIYKKKKKERITKFKSTYQEKILSIRKKKGKKEQSLKMREIKILPSRKTISTFSLYLPITIYI